MLIHQKEEKHYGDQFDHIDLQNNVLEIQLRLASADADDIDF